MPYASVFPISQIFTTPLAVPMTFNGSSYKCVYEKTDISEELNGENYQITAEIPYSTAALIADGDTVTINSINYKVAYRHDTPIGTVILYLSQADMTTPDVSVGTEILASTDFATLWTHSSGVTHSTGEVIFNNPLDFLSYADTISVVPDTTYRLRIEVDEISDGMLDIQLNELDILSTTSFRCSIEGTNDFYYTARTANFNNPGIKIVAVNNTFPITISSFSLKAIS